MRNTRSWLLFSMFNTILIHFLKFWVKRKQWKQIAVHHHYCEIEWLHVKHLSMIMDPMLVNDDYYSFASVLCRGCSFAYFTQVWQSVEWDYLRKHGNSCNSILLTKHPLWKFNFCGHKKHCCGESFCCSFKFSSVLLWVLYPHWANLQLMLIWM